MTRESYAPLREVVYVAFLCLLAVGLAGLPAAAQDGGGDVPTRAFRTRGVLTGVSDASEPEGYKVYSAIAMEGNLTFALSRSFALSWTIGTQSREVEFMTSGAGKVNLGSLELLPVDVMLQYQLRKGGRFHPYVGGGLNVTVFWEKSGTLDSIHLTTGFGPTAGVGFDYDISPRVVFNADFRIAGSKTDLEAGGTRIASLSLNPATFAAGVGFRF